MGKDPAFQDIAAVFRYDRDWLRRWLRAGKKRYRLYLLVLAILMVNFLMAIPAAQQKAMPVFLSILCAALFLWIFYFSRRADQGLTTADKLYNEGKEYRVFLREDGFSFKSDGREETVPYSEKLEVFETEGCFRLVYREKETFILPKEALSDEQAALLSHFWSERLGKGYHYTT